MAYISSLKFQTFRCYDSAKISDLAAGLVVLYGANGAGKTNVLEALSLLTPGRGLRSAKALEIQCHSAPSKPWAVAGEVKTPYSITKLGTGIDPATHKRTVRIDGQTVRAQTKLAEYLSAVWLTPQMDRLFLDSSSHRRKFLDRMIFAFDPGHAGRVSRYENALSQRSKLLKEGKGDPAWLTGLEAQMAETGVAIAAARLEFVERLQAACHAEGHEEYFPHALLQARGTLEELLMQASALEAEEIFLSQLEQSRERDAVTGGAASGPHKSDLFVKYERKNMPADQCSTGEQKALLIGMIIAHARLIARERGAPPILLLDEVAAHLDERRRAALYEILIELGGQVWLTGTDRDLFAAIEGRAQFFEVRDSTIAPAPQNSAAA